MAEFELSPGVTYEELTSDISKEFFKHPKGHSSGFVKLQPYDQVKHSSQLQWGTIKYYYLTQRWCPDPISSMRRSWRSLRSGMMMFGSSHFQSVVSQVEISYVHGSNQTYIGMMCLWMSWLRYHMDPRNGVVDHEPVWHGQGQEVYPGREGSICRVRYASFLGCKMQLKSVHIQMLGWLDCLMRIWQGKV